MNELSRREYENKISQLTATIAEYKDTAEKDKKNLFDLAETIEKQAEIIKGLRDNS